MVSSGDVAVRAAQKVRMRSFQSAATGDSSAQAAAAEPAATAVSRVTGL